MDIEIILEKTTQNIVDIATIDNIINVEIISGEKIQNLADIAVIDNGNPNNIKYSKQYFNIKNSNLNNKINLFIDAKIIYVKTDHLIYFEKHILQKLINKFVLITHNSDHIINEKYINILNNSNLIKWYGQNIKMVHHKLIAIPIGIANSQWSHGNINLLEQTMKKTANNEKINTLYVNFSVDTNKKIRNEIKNILVLNGYRFTSPNLSWNDYLNELSTYKFAICPEGNGPDSHRIWECLYLGVIPVLKKSISFDQFSDLPILFIDDWKQINDDFLKKQYLKIKENTYKTEKLDLKYWKKMLTDDI